MDNSISVVIWRSSLKGSKSLQPTLLSLCLVVIFFSFHSRNRHSFLRINRRVLPVLIGWTNFNKIAGLKIDLSNRSRLRVSLKLRIYRSIILLTKSCYSKKIILVWSDFTITTQYIGLALFKCARIRDLLVRTNWLYCRIVGLQRDISDN